MMDQAMHRFGPFAIVRTLGRGGMGEVFVARTPWPENPLAAVKRLRPDVARVATFAERFQHEAELAVRLQNPNVVGTLDVGSVDGQLYVASELVRGKDTAVIADRLRERGLGGPAAVAIRLLLDTLSGLAYVHGVRETSGEPLRLVHRDVTPGNVLVGYDGVARLADFGLAKSLLTEKSNLTQHGEILGTPHYLAPEVIRGGRASPAGDLYGLGAVMYRFLTGIAPHQGTTAEVLLKVLSEEPRPLSDLRPDLPPWLVVFLHRLLEKDPSRRPYDATLLFRQLSNDARSAGLLVAPAAVGRWLGSLFDEEKAEEEAEYDRLTSLPPEEAMSEEMEGTVVLARPRDGSRLEAPAPLEEQYLDSQGTELDLSEDEVRAASREPRVEPTTLDGDDEIEEMPTKAVNLAAYPGSIPPDMDSGQEATRIRESQANVSVLPGFVESGHVERDPHTTTEDRELEDDESELIFSATRPMEAAHVSPPTPKRRRNPDSVIVSPVASGKERRRPSSERAKPNEDRRREHRTPRSKSPQNPSTPAAPVVVATTSQGMHGRPSALKRNILMIVSMLVVAVFLGIAIGVVLSHLRTTDAPVAPPVQITAPLQERLNRLKRAFEARQRASKEVPPEAWEYMTYALQAMIEDRPKEAEQKIEEAERLLRTLEPDPFTTSN